MGKAHSGGGAVSLLSCFLLVLVDGLVCAWRGVWRCVPPKNMSKVVLMSDMNPLARIEKLKQKLPLDEDGPIEVVAHLYGEINNEVKDAYARIRELDPEADANGFSTNWVNEMTGVSTRMPSEWRREREERGEYRTFQSMMNAAEIDQAMAQAGLWYDTAKREREKVRDRLIRLLATYTGVNLRIAELTGVSAVTVGEWKKQGKGLAS